VAAYLARRLLQIIPVLILVSFITFVLSYNTPGDPARLLLGQRASEEQIKATQAELGIDAPFEVQYARYMWGLVRHGDLGRSYAKKGMSVSEILREKFAVTLRLAILATLLSAVLGVTAGILSALRPYSLLDFASMLVALLGVSLPAFFLGFLLIVFVARPLGLPVGGYADDSLWQQFRHLLLPSLVLGSLTAAVVARLTRYASVGSIAGASALPVVALLMREPMPSWAAAAVAAALIVWKHRENLRRMAAGTERRLGARTDGTP